ncbi:MAG: threonine aldolase family protein [Gemmatimonadaceae bacterium]
MPSPVIDLRSDTVTRPSSAMRRAMADAEVGDDVLDGDPTVRALEERVASLLGKDRALFFPSGTMANQTGVWLMSRRGTEVLLDAEAHLVHWEIAGLAALCGVQPWPVRGAGLVFDADALRAHIRPSSPNAPAASLVCVENTHNGAGGKVTTLAGLRAIREVATAHGLPVHMDGARLWNASVATGTSVADFATCAETVMVSFSKGLGAPVGAALAGSAAAMRDAWQTRKRFGGGMRQSGILAAAALHGLEHNWPRMHEDHERARELAAAVDGVGGASVVPPDTNIVMIDLPAGIASDTVAARCAEAGVKISGWNASRVRAVTHLDVNRDDVRRAGEVLASVLEKAAKSR